MANVVETRKKILSVIESSGVFGVTTPELIKRTGCLHAGTLVHALVAARFVHGKREHRGLRRGPNRACVKQMVWFAMESVKHKAPAGVNFRLENHTLRWT